MKEQKNTNVQPNDTTELELNVQGLATISKSVKESMVNIDRTQLRYFVDAYYQAQDDRIAKYGQLRAVMQGYDEGDAPTNLAIEWLAKNKKNEELQIKNMLDMYTDNNPVGRWIKSITGIGPVMSAAFLAYFDISKCQYAGQFLSYAGLNDHNNPWLGTDKANKIAEAIYLVHDLRMRITIKALKAYNEDLYASFEKSAKKLVKAYKDPNCSECFDECAQAEDIIEAYDIIVSDIYDEFNDKIQITMDNYINSIQIDIGEFEHIVDNLDESSTPNPIKIYNGEMIPSYLNSSVDMMKSYKIPDTITRNDVIDLMFYIASKNSITFDVIELTSIATGRSYSVVNNGVWNLKKKDTKKGILTKTDLVKYMAKPPYNTDLKVVCYLLGESFCKVSGKPKSLYGRLYKERKAYETNRNLKGKYADQALNMLVSKNWDPTTPTYKAYSSGQLSSGHIDMRAKRFAVKVFLVHLFEIMYMDYYHKAPPVYYPLQHLGHEDYIEPENPYDEFISVPKEYYDNYRQFNHIKSTKDLYGLD